MMFFSKVILSLRERRKIEDVGYRVKENTYTNATSTKRPLTSAPNYKSALEQMTIPLSIGTSKKCSIYLPRRSMLPGGLLDSPSSTLSC